MICTQPPSKNFWEKTARKTSIWFVLIFFSTTEVPSCHCSVFASSGRVQGSGSPQPPSHYPRKQGGHWHSWGNSGLHWFTIPRYVGHNEMKTIVADQRRIEERKEVSFDFWWGFWKLLELHWKKESFETESAFCPAISEPMLKWSPFCRNKNLNGLSGSWTHE